MFDSVANLLDDLNTRGTGTELSNSLVLEVDTMLRPHRGVVNVAAEVAQALDRGCIPSGGKPNTWDEECAADFASIRTLNQPVLLGLAESGSIDVLVVCDMSTDIPLLFDVVKIPSELWTAGIALFECKVFPQL